MPFGLLGTLLLLLPGGGSVLGSWVRQSPGRLWVTPGGTVELSCHFETSDTGANWYKEEADGGLSWIYRSSENSTPKGKYSGKRETPRNFSLIIGPVQREDSGVYYCSPPSPFSPSFGNGTRLIVTNATQPQLSILLPVDEEEDPPGRIPLFCHLRDLPGGWDRVLWQLGDGEVTEVTSVATAMDQRGVLNGWSFTWSPGERWDGAASCTALGGDKGNVTIAIGPREGGCPSWPLALGFSFITILFLLQVTILLCTHRLAREGSSPGRR